ncbi:MAG: ABC transporter ATP-binding protein [Hydrogenoanaerobacterium sp.]
MLKVNELVVNYGYISALRGISLHVEKNEIVSLIGANGAGKTTTLMAISGMVDKTEGTIEFDGKDITNRKPHHIVMDGVSHVPEGRHIFPRLSVEDNLMMGSISKKGLSKSQILVKQEEMFDIFPRLKERKKQVGGTLSGGEQQMLAIARGLMNSPKILMLDEPSLGLAPMVIEEIFELMLKLKKAGTTILLIEQNASMALSISDRAYVLENGEVVLTGTGKELLVNDDVKKAYLGS